MTAAAITVTAADDAPVVIAAPAHADREFKSFPAASVLSSDEHPGQIEAVVSVFDVVDKGKDKIKPGFFAKSLERKLPKGVWGHNWDAPIAKTLEARELAAGDPLLPDGLKALGGLYIKGQFNLDTQRGREAYSDIKFGIIDEFSIGYRTVKARKDEKSGVRELIEGDLFEWSPVLVGMNDRTALLSIKSADGTEPDPAKCGYGMDMPMSATDDPMEYAPRAAAGAVVDRLMGSLGTALYGAINDESVPWPDRRDKVATAIAAYESVLMSALDALLAGKSAEAPTPESVAARFAEALTADYEVVPESKLGKPVNADRVARWKKAVTGMRAHLDELQSDLESVDGTAKADDAGSVETKGVVPYKSGPILEADAWDGAAAEARVKKWASSDGSGDKDRTDWAKLRQAYAYVDADGEGSNFGAYHLLHHDIEDGTLKVARRGVFAAAVIVQGGRGGGAAFVGRIGQAAVDGIRAHLGKHYKDMNMTAPWDQKADTPDPTPEADPTQPPEARADEPPARVPHDDVAKLFTKYMIEFEAPRLGLSTNGSH